MLFPNKFQSTTSFTPIDYEYVHKELKRVGITLKLLWEEYYLKCEESKQLPCGYTKFCAGYNDFYTTAQYTNHIIHKSGIAVEVEHSGKTMEILNEKIGEVTTYYLFVATLSYSQYSYCEAATSMKQEDWIRCHVNIFSFF